MVQHRRLAVLRGHMDRRVPSVVLELVVSAVPQQRLDDREAAPHRGPVQGSLAGAVHRVDLNTLAEEEVRLCQPVIQSGPL